MREMPDRQRLRRLEDQEGMGFPGVDQRDEISRSRWQGERAGVRRTKRAMVDMRNTGWCVIGNVARR